MICHERCLVYLTKSVLALAFAHLLSVLASDKLSAQDLEPLTRSFERHYSSGRFVDALAVARSKLQLAEQTGIQSPEQLVQHLLDFGKVLVPLRRFEEAKVHLERAESLLVEVSTRDSPIRVEISNIFGVVLFRMGQVEKAERRFVDLVGILDQAPDRTIELAQVLYDLGTVYQDTARLDKAEVVYTRSLQLRRDAFGDDHPDVAAGLTALGNLYWLRGKYREARAYYERALLIRDVAAGFDHPVLAVILNNLGAALAELGKFDEAIKLHERALRIRERSLGTTHYDVSVSLNNIGNALRELGRVSESEASLSRALDVRERTVSWNSPALTAILNNLALTYTAMNRSSAVEAIYLRIIGSLTGRADAGQRGLGQVLTNLGRLYLRMGEIDRAKKALQEGYDVSRRLREEQHHEIATALSFLAVAEVQTGRQSEAILHMEQALRIREERLGQNHAHTGIALSRLGKILREAGNLEAAERRLRQGVVIVEAEFGGAHPNTVVAYRELASLLMERKQAAEAFEILNRTVSFAESLESFDSKLFQNRDEIGDGKLAFTEHVRAGWQLWTEPGNQWPLFQEGAFRSAQLAARTAASGALDLMSARVSAGASGLSQRIRATQDLAEARKSLQRQLQEAIGRVSSDRDEALVAALRGQLQAIERQIAALAERVQSEFPQYANLVRPAPLLFGEIRDLLLPNEALVVFVVTPKVGSLPDETYVWVLTKKTSSWVRVHLRGKTLTEFVGALRCGLDREEWEGIGRPSRCRRLLGVTRVPRIEEPLPFSLGIAHELYQSLLGPVEDMIRDKHLLIVPSGPLTSLPFQVLVTEKPVTALPTSFAGYQGAAWLGKRQPLTVMPSVASLQALRKFAKAGAAEKPYLGYGNPLLTGDGSCRRGLAALQTCGSVVNSRDPLQRSGSIDRVYSRGAGQAAVLAEVRSLCPLPDTTFELQCVARSLGAPESEIRLGAAATEADIKRLNETGELAHYRVIHFATHGLLAGDTESMTLRQGEPALVMTPPDTPKDADDEGLLTASEVAQLKLNADWVILSACNTAAGDKLGSEALSGLARAFFYAGARALLVSHWPVYSDAAVQLLDRTFKELRNDGSIGRSEAFRRAMTALIEDASQSDNGHPSVWAPFSVVGEGAKL